MIWFSSIVIPLIVVIIVIVGLFEKKDVYNLFCEGAKEGIQTTITLFPTLIGIFLAVSIVKNSGLFDFLADKLNLFMGLLGLPKEILPLMFLKPISGSASLVIATEIMKQFGVDSRLGMLAGTIMSSSETTFYVIAVYLSIVNIKGEWKVIIPAIIADIVCMVVAVFLV